MIADYSFSESSDVDDGQLDGVSLASAFILGVEWEMLREALALGGEIDMPIHKKNLERIQRLCLRRSRRYSHKVLDDIWVQFIVEA